MKSHPRPRTAAGRTAPNEPMRLAATALSAALVFTLGAADAAPPERSSEGPWAKSRVLVMPKPGLSDSELEKIARAQGGRPQRLGGGPLYVIELPGNASERAVAARLAGNPHLEFVELDHEVSTTSTANDPYFGSAWHLSRVKAPSAWNTAQGNGVTIAIIDTGVDAAHPDLKDKLVPGWNFYDNNTNTSDVKGHGTGVAGAAAATTNNSVGVASVATSAKIMPIRATDTSGVGYISMIANGITWAADKGAKVINLSFDRLWTFSSVVSAAQYAKNKGALVVIAASNNAKDEGSTQQTAMIPVSATDKNDALTSFSSWGNHVAVAAPGLDIWSTTRGGGYGAWWGTSVSSPITAGVVALMMSANPKLSNADVEKLLYASARDLGTAGRDIYYGHGLVDAEAAVTAALSSSASATDVEAPKVAVTSPTASSTVGGLVTVNVSATDNVGVSKVELRVNGSLLAGDLSAPYSFSWDSTKVANGMASLQATAYDAAGNVATSSTVSVNVANLTSASTDTTPPVVGISNPANGSKVSGTVAVTATGSDNNGTAGLSLALSLNGKQVATSSGTGTLKYSWNTRRISAGSYTLTVTARDAAGNSSSNSITVTR